MTTALPVLFAHHAVDDVVLIGAGRAFTRGQLCARVVALASTLPSGPGDALVACEGRVAFAVAVLAAWRVGLGVALPPNLRPSTLAEVGGASSVVTTIDDARVDAALERAMVDAQDDAVLPVMAPNDPLATIYTSGTTGRHRPVPKTAAQLLGEAHVLSEMFEVGARSRVLATVPPHHIYGLLFGMLLPFVSGAVAIARASLHPPAIAAAAREHGATVLVSTPAHLRGLGVLERDALPAFERVFSSGAPLHPRTSALLAERFGLSVVEVLGSTETGGIGWRVADAGPERPWQPLPGVVVEADDDGRMLLTSPFLPASLSQPWPADDRIEVEDDRSFWHRGRVDGVVKIGGKRVSPRAVEARLLEQPGVLDAAVVVAEGHDDEQPRLKALVVAPDVEVEVLRQSLLQWFDPVALPRPLRRVAEIPREESGKIVRERLLALLDRTDGEPEASA